jgi:hypothetical protein
VAVLLPLLGSLVLTWRGVTLTDGLAYTSPVFAVLAAINGRPPPLVYSHLAGNALLAAAVLALAARHLLGLRQVRGTRGPALLGLGPRPHMARPGQAPRAARPALSGNPIAWSDLYLVHGGQAGAWTKAALISVLLLVVIPLLCRVIGLPADEVWAKAWVSLCLGHAVAWGLGTLAAISHAFDREKSSGALDMLLTSDLDNEDLLYGKLGGVLHGYSPYLYSLLVALALAFLVYGEVLFQYHLLLVLIELGAVWFACCSAALYLAVRLPASRNATLYFGLYLLAWAIIVLTFRQHGEIAHALFALITAIWHLYVGSLCWRLLLRHCREMLLHGGAPPAALPAP